MMKFVNKVRYRIIGRDGSNVRELQRVTRSSIIELPTQRSTDCTEET